MTNFARTLQKLMKAHHLSQKEIENRTAINQSTVSRYRSGATQPKLSVLSDLLLAFPEKKDQCELFCHWVLDQTPESIKSDLQIKTPFSYEEDEFLFEFPKNAKMTPKEHDSLISFIELYQTSSYVRDLVYALQKLVDPPENLRVAEDPEDYPKK